MAYTIRDLVTGAAAELRVARAGDVLAPAIADLGLTLVNEILDLWNADDRAVYTELFADYTLTPNLSPHTIGPTGTFVVASRPKSVIAASLNIGGNPASFLPITVRDDPWYAALTVPGLTAAIPTDVYYEQDWPNGKLFFWPVPTTAYGVRLWSQTVLSAVTLATTFALPPGYQAALRLTLAEWLGPAMGQAVSASTARRANEARALVFGDNDDVPRIATADAGIGGRQSARGGFNWLNRNTA